jgi:hypothetical protein
MRLKSFDVEKMLLETGVLWHVTQHHQMRCHSKVRSPAQKTFDAEGEILEHALTKSFRLRDEAIKSLCTSVRRFRYATIKEECKPDYPHALQALWKALDRAEDLIQN